MRSYLDIYIEGSKLNYTSDLFFLEKLEYFDYIYNILSNVNFKESDLYHECILDSNFTESNLNIPIGLLVLKTGLHYTIGGKKLTNLYNYYNSPLYLSDAVDNFYIDKLWTHISNIQYEKSHEYKRLEDYLKKESNILIYKAPAFNELDMKLKQLNHWYVSTDVHPLIKAVVYSYMLLYLKPYLNNNTLISRLIIKKILHDSGYYNISYVPLIKNMYENKLYYNLSVSNIKMNLGNIDSYLNFILDMYIKSLRQRIEFLDIKYFKLSKLEQNVYELLSSSNSYKSIHDLSKEFNINIELLDTILNHFYLMSKVDIRYTDNGLLEYKIL